MPEVRRFVMMSVLVLLVGCGGASAPRGNPQQITDAGPAIDAGTPTAAGWTPLRQVPEGVGEAAIAAADGKIYLIGGYDTLPLFQIYDIAADSWSQGPALVAGTDNAGALATNGKVYVFGGEASPRVQIYDVAQRQWSTGPDLPSPRFSSVVEQMPSGFIWWVAGASAAPTMCRWPATPCSTSWGAATSPARSPRCRRRAITPTPG